MSHKPELVAPAGDWGALRSAVESGADAVYFGVKGFNMRDAALNFDVLQLRKVMDFLRENKVKGYLALNVIVYDDEAEKVRKVLEEAKKAGVDAVILWDMAVMSIAGELGLKVHLSTQASVSNFEAVKFYAGLGVKRIVLARECTLKHIKAVIRRIREEKIDCEIEAFVHGAMCVSISGRCFLSQYSFGKSANRGECVQPCRREFAIADVEDECSYELGENYILSPRDLCAIGFIDDLISSGISAFKIEGRMRPAEYVKIVTASYRKAIDAFSRGRLTEDLKKELTGKMRQVFNRDFSDGFYFGASADLGARPCAAREKTYLGEVVKFYAKIGVAEVALKNGPLKKGEEILVSGRTTPAAFARVEEMQVDHKPVGSACKGGSVGIKLPFTVRAKDKVFLWKEKNHG